MEEHSWHNNARYVVNYEIEYVAVDLRYVRLDVTRPSHRAVYAVYDLSQK